MGVMTMPALTIEVATDMIATSSEVFIVIGCWTVFAVVCVRVFSAYTRGKADEYLTTRRSDERVLGNRQNRRERKTNQA